MRRPALLLALLLSLLCLIPFPASAADPAMPGTAWLERFLEAARQQLPALDARLAKQEATLRQGQDLSAKAQAAGNAEAAAMAAAAVKGAQAARDKTLAARRQEEANIAKVQAMLDSLRAGKGAPKLRECADLASAVERDTAQAAKHKEESDKANAAREEWTDSAIEARRDALKQSIDALTVGLAEYLQRLEYSARAYKGWITRYRKQLAEKGVDVDRLLGKISDEKLKYLAARLKVDLMSLLQLKQRMQEMDFEAKAEAVKNAVSLLALELGKVNASVRETLEVPAVRELLNTERPDVDLEMFVVGDLVLKPLLKAAGLKALPVDFASFVVNYGYDMAKVKQSLDRVKQYTTLADQQLAAANAMQKRITEDMARFKACKEELFAREGVREP
jgi:hypothetical protein